MLGTIRSSRSRYEQYRLDARRQREQRRHRTLPEDTTRAKPQDAAPRPARRSTWTLIAAFVRQARPHRGAIAWFLLTSAAATLVSLVPLYGMKVIFDNVLAGNPLPDRIPAWLPIPTDRRALLLTVVGGMCGLTVMSVLIKLASDRMSFRVQRHMILASRRRLFHHTLRLPLHRLRQITSGGAAFIVRHDANAVGDLVVYLIYQPWKAVIQLVGCLAVLAWTDWRLLVGSIALMPVIYFAQRARVGRIRDTLEDALSQEQRLDGLAAEVFGGVRVIRGFGRERIVASRFARRHHFVNRMHLYGWLLNRGIDLVWAILIPVATGALLAFGGMRVLSESAAVAAGTLDPADALTLGGLIMFLGYLAWLLNPLATLTRSAAQLQNSLAGLNRAMDVLEEPVDVEDRPDARALRPDAVNGTITIRDLAFAYPGSDDAVLRGIDLDVPAGQTVAFVGSSGAGKTTITNLIARFYDPTQGSITIDGIDLRDVRVASYRRLLGIVEQDIFLFDGTIAENIACGNRAATREQIIDASQRAYAHEFIVQLSNGYDTPVGERGLRLSGGQRQRIAIARAMLADPKVLILDEATSQLDTENERLIQQSLASLMRGRTCFVIAHRLSTIRHADQIVVMDAGRIVERGKHDELMARSGRYRHMIELQLDRESAAAVGAA